MLRLKWPPKEITKDSCPGFSGRLFQVYFAEHWRALGAKLGHWVRWFEGLRIFVTKPTAAKMNSPLNASRKFLLKGNGLYANKKSILENNCQIWTPKGFQYVSHPLLHAGNMYQNHFTTAHRVGAREYMHGEHLGDTFTSVKRWGVWRSRENIQRMSESITGRMDNLCLFGRWNSVFSHGQELQGESGEPPNYIRNQDGYHGLNGNSGSLITHHWRISLNLHTLQ